MANSKIKKTIKNLPVIGKLFPMVKKIFFPKRNNSYDAPAIWLHKLIKGDNIQIVQIGSNDGRTGDPIYDLVNKNLTWKALFVEPIPYLFKKLKSNYGNDPRFLFENAAINDGTQQVFYAVKEEAKANLPDLPNWYDQLGSFNKENISKHLDGVLVPYIDEVLLTGLTIQDLFKRNQIQEIDLLHIDTEGYDWKILSQLNLNYIKPKLILIEHKHLSQIERDSLIHFLKTDYLIFKLGGDMLGILKNHPNMSEIKKLNGLSMA